MRNIEQQVFSFLQRAKKGYKPRELAKSLQVTGTDYAAFRSLAKRLVQEGRLIKMRGNRLALPSGRNEQVGVLKICSERFGFVAVDGQPEEIYVRTEDLGTAQHNDKVEVRITQAKGRKGPRGRIVKVLERGHPVLVGTFMVKSGGQLVVPDHKRFLKPVLIPPGRDQGAHPGDKVVAQVDEWSHQMLYGSVKKVLGSADDPRVRGLEVAHAFGLPLTFPAAVEEEAVRVAGKTDPAAMKNRRDLRDQLVFTIDPETAQDFDDAVSIERATGQGFRLGVHIADVGHYVREGTALDKEALARGNSVYLADRVIPMLPEPLSADRCSLKPACDRLTFSVIMEIDSHGRVTGYTPVKSVINSSQRLTYTQTQELLEGKRLSIKHETAVRQALAMLKELKDILWAKRRGEGGLDLEVPEATVKLDEAGRPVYIGIEKRLETHRIIEECMLAANRTVAEHLKAHGGLSLYRIHEEPEAMALESYWDMMRRWGFINRKDREPSARQLQSFLDGLPEHGRRIGHELLLRSLKKAVYSVRNRGHFGLGFACYTHFTSPIRRYADLAVHRLLARQLAGETAEDKAEAARHLELVAAITTEREQVSLEAERESIKVMQIQYLQDRRGDHFDGQITGVHRVGLFVVLDQLLAEGLVPIGTLEDDYYLVDEKQQTLTGQRRKKRFRVGERVKVQLVRTDRDRREIDFRLVEKL